MKTSLFSFFLFVSVYFFGQEPPNFLWLVCEDQSLFFSMYGDSSANTPNINKLAKDGIVYQNCYTTSPVCAPSRSSLITGMYPTTIGTQHMRAYKKSEENNEINSHNLLPYYSAKPKKPIRFFTENLRVNGYYCTNNSKEDYNMVTSPLAWDESSQSAHWRKRKEGQPFFSVFNFNATHESNIWNNKNSYSKEDLANVGKSNQGYNIYATVKGSANHRRIGTLDPKRTAITFDGTSNLAPIIRKNDLEDATIVGELALVPIMISTAFATFLGSIIFSYSYLKDTQQFTDKQLMLRFGWSNMDTPNKWYYKDLDNNKSERIAAIDKMLLN